MTTDLWKRYASAYDTLESLTPYQRSLDLTCEQMDLQSGERVLDVGCGTGNLLKRCSVVEDTVLSGIDGSTEMLAIAKEKLPNADLQLMELDGLLPFSDNSFHKIACLNTLYAVSQPETVLAEIYRLLVPGGICAISNPTPGFDHGWVLREHAKSTKPISDWEGFATSLERATELIKNAVPEEALWEDLITIAQINIEIQHTRSFHFYSEEELLQLIQNAGFTVKKLYTVHAGVSALIIANKEIRDV